MPDIETAYNIPRDHPSLEGHFPGNPLIPGVVIIEKVLHSISQLRPSDSYKIVKAKFLQPLIPPAILSVHLAEKTGNRINFKAMVKADVIAKGIIEVKPESHV